MKSRISILIISMAMFASCKKPDGKISGVVTYYFNENYGDKPDVGAKIYINNRNDGDSSKVAAIEKFSTAKIWMSNIESSRIFMESDSNLLKNYTANLNSPYFKSERDYYLKKIDETQEDLKHFQKDIEKNWERLREMEINASEDYSKLSETASSQIMDFQLARESKSFTADGAGAYSTNLPPGKYYVLIVSNHRHGHSPSDLLGQIEFNHETIESEKETTSNAKFSID